MDLNPYAKYLGDQEPIPVLTTTIDAIRGLVAPLTSAQIDRSPAPGKWSIREITAHLADCEIVFCFRLRQALSEEHSIIQPFDQDRWSERYAAYNFESALALFQAARTWNLRLLTTISEEDRHHPTTHPERGTMTFWTIVETMAGHDINHLLQIGKIAEDSE
jgi:uncharacterized damage-inducible protein DinB